MQDSLDLNLGLAEDGALASRVRRKPHVRRHVVFRELSDQTPLALGLRALVDDDDACIWIREGLRLMDLSFLQAIYQDFGGIAYDPLAMLGILIYAYSKGQTGSRTIETLCRRDIGYMYVGYGQKPDDRTIRRFRRRVGPHLDKVFNQLLEVCKGRGLLPMRLVAVDGTKIASAASQLSFWISKAEKQDVVDMGLEVPDCSDPDARTMKARRGYLTGYNCQAAVDCDSGVVMAIEVSNVSSDGGLLAPMAQSIVKNTRQTPAQIVADAGYDTTEAADTCQKLEVEAIIAQHDSSSTFWSITHDECIVCPMGNEAKPAGNVTQHGKPYQLLKVVGCPSCAFFMECCGNTKAKAKTLSFPEGTDPIHRMNAAYRARSPEGKLAMRERMANIEPVFADIKCNKGLDRFVLRGLEGVRIEWTLIHLARNLRALKARLIRLILGLLRLLRPENPTGARAA